MTATPLAPQTTDADHEPPSLLLPFSGAVLVVIGAIVLLALAETTLALMAALAALGSLLVSVVLLVNRVLEDDGEPHPIDTPVAATTADRRPRRRAGHHHHPTAGLPA